MAYIIVPLDGSELAERAVPFAASLAQLTGFDVELVEAAISPTSLEVGMDIDLLVDCAREYLNEQAAAIRKNSTSEVKVRAAIAPAIHLILDEAHQPDAGALVMSTHGRTGFLRLLLGSVAEGVLRHSPVPVYLLPAAAGAPRPLRLRRILVPLDGSDLAYSVMAPVEDLARRTGAEITLLRIFHEYGEGKLEAREYFGPIKARLRKAGLLVNSEWSVGDPATHIAHIAERLDVDVIALATHGRSGLARLRYGSVAEAVLRHAAMPVMTFGPEAIRRLASDVDALTRKQGVLVEV